MALAKYQVSARRERLSRHFDFQIQYVHHRGLLRHLSALCLDLCLLRDAAVLKPGQSRVRLRGSVIMFMVAEKANKKRKEDKQEKEGEKGDFTLPGRENSSCICMLFRHN
jgi:hypothetical protein